MEDRAILVDGMNLCYRHYHVKKNDKNAFRDGRFVGLFEGFFITLKLIRKRHPRHAIYILWDAKTRRRHVVDPNYKKKTFKDDKDEAEKKAERELIYGLVEDLKDMLVFDGINQVYAEGYEADDLAGYLVDRFEDYKDVVLWTSDRDWTQLMCENVRWVDSHSNSTVPITAGEFEKKEGYPASGVTVYKSLTGDKSDNIKGVLRFPKKWAKVIASRTTSIEGLFYDRAILLDLPEKWRDIIKENTSKLRLNFQLVSLYREIGNAVVTVGCEDKVKLKNILSDFGMMQVNSRSKKDDFFRRRMKIAKSKKEKRT